MEKQRNATIDFLRIVAAILVILIHTVTQKKASPALYFVAVTVGRYAVPFFMIITGYFYFLNPNNTRLKKTITNVLWLWVIWNVIYLPAGIYHLITIKGIKEKILRIIWSFIGQSLCFGAAWYLVALAFGLLIVDFFRRKNKMWLCDVVALIVLFIDCASTNYQHIFPKLGLISKEYWGISIVTGILWVTVAYYIAKYRNLAPKIGNWVSFIIAIGLTVLERLFVQHSNPSRTDLYFTLPISMFLIFMFILNLSYFKDANKVIVMRNMATLMFFVQFMVIDILKLKTGAVKFLIVLIVDVILSFIVLKMSQSKYGGFLKKIY